MIHVAYHSLFAASIFVLMLDYILARLPTRNNLHYRVLNGKRCLPRVIYSTRMKANS